MLRSILTPLFLAAATIHTAAAQSTSSHTDPTTGITFQRFFSAGNSFSFGLALPATPTDEFIGQIVAPSAGWAGVSFGGGMLNNLLLTAWANGDEIVHSFRMTGAYTLPTVYTETAPTLTPLSCGTSVNATHLSLTFTCANCHQWVNTYGEEAGFDIAGDFAVMGWAYGGDTPADPGDERSAFLQHTGFGQYGMLLGEARSAEYDEWKTC